MSRIQLALNVDNLDRAVAFYSTLFDTEPAKLEPGYANFAVEQPPLKLVLLENTGAGGTINHLGVEVETSEQVHAEITRLSQAGLPTTQQMGTTCCYAQQDKVWITGPHGEKWEVYTVLADTGTFGDAPEFVDEGSSVQACCGTEGESPAAEPCCGSAADAAAEGACCTADATRAAVGEGATCCS